MFTKYFKLKRRSTQEYIAKSFLISKFKLWNYTPDEHYAAAIPGEDLHKAISKLPFSLKEIAFEYCGPDQDKGKLLTDIMPYYLVAKDNLHDSQIMDGPILAPLAYGYDVYLGLKVDDQVYHLQHTGSSLVIYQVSNGKFIHEFDPEYVNEETAELRYETFKAFLTTVKKIEWFSSQVKNHFQNS